MDFSVEMSLDGRDAHRRPSGSRSCSQSRVGPPARQMGRDRSPNGSRRCSSIGARSQQSHGEGVSFLEGMRLLAGVGEDGAAAADGADAKKFGTRDWSQVVAGALAEGYARRHARSGGAGRVRPGGGSAGAAAALPGGRRALAAFHYPPRTRRVPGRRHGPGQDHPDHRAAAPVEARERRVQQENAAGAVPARGARVAAGELEKRARPVRPGAGRVFRASLRDARRPSSRKTTPRSCCAARTSSSRPIRC